MPLVQAKHNKGAEVINCDWEMINVVNIAEYSKYQLYKIVGFECGSSFAEAKHVDEVLERVF